MPTTNYIWDVETDSYLMETDGSNVTQAVYTNEPNPFGALISQRRGSEIRYCHFDGLTTTRELSDPSETVMDEFVFDAWGNEIAHAGATTLPFRWGGEVEYLYDAEIEQEYVRARTYAPDTGRWSSADPIGVVLSPNLYSMTRNNPINLLDPSGLEWTHIGGTLYRCCHDPLTDLAQKITGNPADWVCIWPVVGQNSNSWTAYPLCMNGGIADVRNLTAEQGPTLKMIPKTQPDDHFLNAAARVIGGPHKWTSGAHAARMVMQAAAEGSRPIKLLVIGGHCDGSKRICGQFGANCFVADDLYSDATGWFTNAWNTLDKASAMKGPPKCWFTRNADVYGFACESAKMWMPDWAANVLRKGAFAHGAQQLVFAEWQGRFHRAWFEEDPNNRARNLRELLALKSWKKKEGEL